LLVLVQPEEIGSSSIGLSGHRAIFHREIGPLDAWYIACAMMKPQENLQVRTKSFASRAFVEGQ
jgi:hypothetical protein